MQINTVKQIPGIHTANTISNWNKLIQITEDEGLSNIDNKWLFRGQNNVNWDLKSTFERAKAEIITKPAWEYEAAILREFTRRAHHYIDDLPKSSAVLEWFSLMRHYGAPCRLLDFTYSFYVALYFALKNIVNNEIAAIWAIKHSWLRDRFRNIFQDEDREDFRFKEPKDFYRHFLDPDTPHNFVAPVNPFRMNQKLTAQQGIFLCPGNIAKPFMDNLLVNGKENGKEIIRIPLHASIKTEALKHLWRMNINSATLFPDLAGFAEYLSDWFHLPLSFNDKDLRSALQGYFPGGE